MSTAVAGQPWILDLEFYDEESGVLTDPASVQLDITYGTEVGLVPDTAGPWSYQGASSAAPGQVWRTGVGQYAAVWYVPYTAATGVYVANWTCQYGSDVFLGTENFTVAGGATPTVPAGDTGFWTGGLIYGGLDVEFGQVDSSGIAWLWQKIEGWDGPDVQGAGVIAKSGDHGAWASPQYYAARALTLTVTASAPTQSLRDRARAVLQQAVPISDLAVLRYDEPIPKQALVRRSGKLTEAYPTLADVTFTIGLVAPDPRKYSTVPRTITIGLMPASAGGGMVVPFSVPIHLDPAPPPSSAVASNQGSFETRPIVTIQGPVSGPLLGNLTSGQQVSWSSLTLGTGDTLVVDFPNAQAFVNPLATPQLPGQAVTGGTYWPADITSSWWSLQPGENVVQYGGTAGTGSTASVTWWDAWA